MNNTFFVPCHIQKNYVMLREPHLEAIIHRFKGLMWTPGIMNNMFRIKTLVTILFPALLYVSHTHTHCKYL